MGKMEQTLKSEITRLATKQVRATHPAAPAAPPVGLECPACGCRQFKTVETRPRPGMILRRKACRHCGHRVTTREKVLSAK